MFWTERDLSLYYEVLGEGTPIVLLHGYRVDHHLMSGCMEPIFKDLPNYQRIYLDLPGMGQSNTVDWVDCADALLEVLQHFLHDLLGDSPFLIAAESYGGYLARGLIRAMRHQILGALFLCPCILPDFGVRTVPVFHAVIEDAAQFASLPGYAGFRQFMCVQTPHTWQRYQKEVLSGNALSDSSYLDAFQKHGYAFSFSVDQVDIPYPFPALFLTGRQDDCVGYEDAWQIQKNFSASTFLVLDGAGHNLQIDQELIFEALSKNWLLSVQASRGIHVQ